jgi:hypothetical protein
MPFFAPLGTGEVVISVPALKFFELLTLPVIEPFGFCFQFFRTGMLVGTGAALGVALAGPPPKIDIVPADFEILGWVEGAGFGFGACGMPNKLIVPDRLGIFGAILGFSFGSDVANKLKLGLGAGEGAGGATFGLAGWAEKNEKAEAGFGAGAGTGAGAGAAFAFGAGEEKKENAGAAGAFLGAG